jgi:asparagine synthase (glutamine-hydrolysing)
LLSPQARDAFLAFGAVWSREAIVQGVEELDPATVLTYEAGHVARERYWTAPVSAISSAPTNLSGAVEIVSPVLREAVALQLRSDVPLGIFLSAGLDSSALAALASEALGAPPITLTVNFEGPGAEGSEALAIAKALGTDHRQVDIAIDQAAAWVPEAVAAMDQPSVDGVNTWIVSRAAREAGLKVCLSGLGGDEVFAGYSSFRSFASLLRLGRWLWPLERMLAASRERRPFSSVALDGKLRKAAWLLSERGERAGTYSALRGLFPPEQAIALWGAFDRDHAYRDNVRGDGPDDDAVNALSRLELANYLRATLLRDTDAMSMSHGLEVRPPLLDERLAVALLGLPGHLKMAPGLSKPLLWGCVKGGRLPGWLSTRPKTGFGLPFDLWLDGPLRAWHRQGLEAAKDLGLTQKGERQLSDARAHGALSWHRWFAPAVLGHWAARNGVAA